MNPRAVIEAAPRDDHLVEKTSRKGNQQEHPASDVAALFHPKRFNKTQRDGRKNHDTGNPGGDDKRQNDRQANQTQQDVRIRISNPLHDEESDASRQS